MHGRGHAWQGCAWQGDLHGKEGMHGGGVCMAGSVWQGCMAVGMHGGGGAYVAGEIATAADGTHPSGMHSFTT